VARTASALGIDAVLGGLTQTPLGLVEQQDFDKWLENVSAYLGRERLDAAIIWPPQPDRGRIYVHLLDAGGTSVAFAKLSFDQTNNEALRRESDVLRALSGRSGDEWRVPEILHLGQCGANFAMTIQPLPKNVTRLSSQRKNYPAKVVAQYAGPIRTVPLELVNDLSWWSAYKLRTDSVCEFSTELSSRIVRGVRVCFVHGDLTPGNIIRQGKTLWIVDWEDSVSDGPVCSDWLAYLFRTESKDLLKDPIAWLRSLYRSLHRSSAKSIVADLMTAIAFHYARGIPEATQLVMHWRGENLEWL